MVWPLGPLYGDVFCLTCDHAHVATIPAVTFACADCGYGGWIIQVAERHAASYPDHIVHPVHHQTVPLPRERPELTTDDDGYPTAPDGWGAGGWLLLGDGLQVLAGWDDTGTFHQYADTETILAAFRTHLETHDVRP